MINIAGVISISLFYLLILGVGIWAGRKKEEGNDSEEEVMLAGRSIGLFVGIFTMTGTYWLMGKSFLDIMVFIINVFFSYLGWWRLYKWYSRSNLHLRSGMVSGSIWLRVESRLW